jgi:GNAT superfamily N-acetyltransferase
MVIDHSIAVRVEDTLAADVGCFVEGLQSLDPASGAVSTTWAGGWAHLTGPGLFGNRAQAAGLRGAVAAEDLRHLARFYDARSMPVEVEVCPHADPSLLHCAGEHGLCPAGFRNVYVHGLEPHPPAEPGRGSEIVTVGEAEFDTWSATLLDGFGYEQAHARRRVARWNRMLFELRPATLFLARRDGRAVGAANVLVHGATASLGGTTTLPAERRHGVQAALLTARLAFARASGCTLAVVTADPGGASARNAERAGFRLTYTNVRLRSSAGERRDER